MRWLCTTIDTVLVGRSFVVARGAARLAVHQAISTKPHIDHGLTEAAIFLAHATRFGLFTLGAAKFGGTGCGAHAFNLAPAPVGPVMTLVIGWRHHPAAIHNALILRAL
jgi:hypothetical protein